MQSVYHVRRLNGTEMQGILEDNPKDAIRVPRAQIKLYIYVGYLVQSGVDAIRVPRAQIKHFAICRVLLRHFDAIRVPRAQIKSVHAFLPLPDAEGRNPCTTCAD